MSDFNTNSKEYLVPEQVTYDPSIDPHNMSQYNPKDYKVTAVYQKLDNNNEPPKPAQLETRNSEDSTTSDSTIKAPLPKYLDAIQDIEANDPVPPYEQLELDTSNYDANRYQHSSNPEDGSNPTRQRKNKKMLKIALHFMLFFFIISIIQISFQPLGSFGCGGRSEEYDDIQTPAKSSTTSSNNYDTDSGMMMSYNEMDEMMGEKGAGREMMGDQRGRGNHQ